MEEALSPEIAEAEVEDIRTIARKGTGRGRVEVLGRERRRSWTPEQKRAIVVESLGPELTPSEVARKYAISSGLALFVAPASAGRTGPCSGRIRAEFCAGRIGTRAAFAGRR